MAVEEDRVEVQAVDGNGMECALVRARAPRSQPENDHQRRGKLDGGYTYGDNGKGSIAKHLWWLIPAEAFDLRYAWQCLGMGGGLLALGLQRRARQSQWPG
jgi:hypothetical protein